MQEAGGFEGISDHAMAIVAKRLDPAKDRWRLLLLSKDVLRKVCRGECAAEMAGVPRSLRPRWHPTLVLVEDRMKEFGFAQKYMISVGMFCPIALETLALEIPATSHPHVTWMRSFFSDGAEAPRALCDFVSRLSKGISCEECVFSGRHIRNGFESFRLPPEWPWINNRAQIPTASLLMLGKRLFEVAAETFGGIMPSHTFMFVGV